MPRQPRGPLDPPNRIPTTLSQIAAKKHLGTPRLPPIGFERQFRRRSTLKDGEGDESLEVGVLKYGEGPGVVSVSVEIDTEVLVGRDQSCKIQLYGASVSSFHLRFYAVRTSSSLSIVCMNDISSSTGYILNGKHFPPGATYRLGQSKVGSKMIILRDGDQIQVPGTPQVLQYKHNSIHFPINPEINKQMEEHSLFDTTSSDHYIETNAWRIHNYPLGDGNFGVVNLATHRLGGVQAAIKTIDSRTSGSERWRERLADEVGNMKKLNHPNVMKVLDKIKDMGQDNNGGELEDENNRAWNWASMGIWKAHIVFELATGGDLFSYVESQRPISEDEAKFMGWQLVLGLEHIHSRDVAHRDLKLENILLHNRNSFPRLLIGDFGFSITLETLVDSVPPGNGNSTRDNYPAGTLINLPPERLKSFTKTTKTSGLGESLHGQARKEKIGKKWFEEELELDHWGLGVVMYNLIAARHPYAEESKSVTSATAKPRRGKGKKIETQETIDQFPTQSQSQSGEEASRCKRKLREMEVESEEDEDCSIHAPPNKGWVGYGGIGSKSKYAVRPAGYSWDEFRETHGAGTVGGSESNDMRIASRALEDIKVFVDKPPDSWKPIEAWDQVSPDCRDFIGSLLAFRVHQRMKIPQAKEHSWFESSEEDLELLYDQVVIKGIHNAGPS